MILYFILLCNVVFKILAVFLLGILIVLRQCKLFLRYRAPMETSLRAEWATLFKIIYKKNDMYHLATTTKLYVNLECFSFFSLSFRQTAVICY